MYMYTRVVRSSVTERDTLINHEVADINETTKRSIFPASLHIVN